MTEGEGEATTRLVRLDVDKWVDLGEGPVHLGVFGAEALMYAIGDRAPAAAPGFTLRRDGQAIDLATRSRIWARAPVSGACAIVARLDEGAA